MFTTAEAAAELPLSAGVEVFETSFAVTFAFAPAFHCRVSRGSGKNGFTMNRVGLVA
jgi:hypothetical protein